MPRYLRRAALFCQISWRGSIPCWGRVIEDSRYNSMQPHFVDKLPNPNHPHNRPLYQHKCGDAHTLALNSERSHNHTRIHIVSTDGFTSLRPSGTTATSGTTSARAVSAHPSTAMTVGRDTDTRIHEGSRTDQMKPLFELSTTKPGYAVETRRVPAPLVQEAE